MIIRGIIFAVPGFNFRYYNINLLTFKNITGTTCKLFVPDLCRVKDGRI